jgi:Uma2 family endonuclease
VPRFAPRDASCYKTDMNAPAVKRMAVPEFLAWAETQENGRFELVCGQIVAMAPERWEHVQAKQRAFRALEAAIERAGVACQALIDGLAVAVDDETSYIPDSLVNCGEPGAPDSLIAPNPVIVVEVLSPSTRNIDTTVNLADYFRVPGLRHYVIVDLGRQHVVHYRKQDGTVTVVVMTEGEIAFDPPGISVAVTSFLR